MGVVVFFLFFFCVICRMVGRTVGFSRNGRQMPGDCFFGLRRYIVMVVGKGNGFGIRITRLSMSLLIDKLVQNILIINCLK